MIKVALELQPCCSQKSGIGYYTYEIAKRLKNNEKYQFYGNICNFMNRNKLNLTDISYELVVNTKIPYGVYRRLWNKVNFSYDDLFKNNADINHFFNYIVPPNIKGKVIDTIHDLGFLYYPEYLDKRNLVRIKRDIDYSLERSDSIVTVSESVKSEIIKEFNIEPSKIDVVYNAPTLSDEYMDKSYLSTVWNVYDDYFLYVGNIEPRKNLIKLIEAYDYLKKNENIPLKLMIVGQVMWNSKEVFALIEKLNLTKDIIFTGYVTEIEKNTLYKFCSAFVYPSIYEGFGIPVVDALYSGKNVVCSDIPVFHEITNDNAFFVDYKDSKDIAEKMYKAIKFQLDTKSINEFNWEDSVEKVLNIYNKLGGM